MNLSRRSALGILAAGLARPSLALASTAMTEIVARAGLARLAPEDYPETAIWGYDGGVPGPLIRVPQSGRLQRRLVNQLPEATAIHWHGVRIENAMDGVPGFTQHAVKPGESFDYDAAMPDAGTFWYHSHNRSAEQVARGLYGPLIIDEPERPDVDHDVVVIVDDWRLTEQAQIHESFGNLHDLSHAGRIGNYVHIEMLSAPERLGLNERVRFRFINPSTDRILRLRLMGMTGWVMALDGMPLENPQPLAGLELAPAQRVDVFADAAGEGAETAIIVQEERDAGYVLAEFEITPSATTKRRPDPAPLPPNPVQSPVLSGDTQALSMVMKGGAMRGLESGVYNGQEMTMQELVANGQVWTLNGVAGFAEEPWAKLSLGETVRISLRNDTAFAHGMHLHGHHFREVLPDGGLGPFRDTLLVQPSQTRDIAFVADNPGKWLFHCHMLSHQTAGMKTWLQVG